MTRATARAPCGDDSCLKPRIYLADFGNFHGNIAFVVKLEREGYSSSAFYAHYTLFLLLFFLAFSYF